MYLHNKLFVEFDEDDSIRNYDSIIKREDTSDYDGKMETIKGDKEFSELKHLEDFNHNVEFNENDVVFQEKQIDPPPKQKNDLSKV